MYTCTKFQQYITNNRLVVVKYSSAIFSLSLQKSEKWPKVKGQFELFRLQSAHEGSLHIRFYFYFNWLWNSEFLSSFLWVCKKVCKKRRPLQKNSGSFSILNKYDPMRILCRFTCGMNILMILTANFLNFFHSIQLWGQGQRSWWNFQIPAFRLRSYVYMYQISTWYNN